MTLFSKGEYQRLFALSTVLVSSLTVYQVSLRILSPSPLTHLSGLPFPASSSVLCAMRVPLVPFLNGRIDT